MIVFVLTRVTKSFYISCICSHIEPECVLIMISAYTALERLWFIKAEYKMCLFY